MSDRYSGVKSVDVACRIVEVFSNEGPRLALKDIAMATRMPPSKIHTLSREHGTRRLD